MRLAYETICSQCSASTAPTACGPLTRECKHPGTNDVGVVVPRKGCNA